jgi:bla regulator protein blaR1
MIVWMLFSVFVSLIVAAAARAAESLVRLTGARVRWVWLGALALSVLLAASATHRRSDGASPGPPSAGSIDLNPSGAVRLLDRGVAPSANVVAALLSTAGSLGLVFMLVAVGRRFRRARREWPRVVLHGVDVRVAPRVGPLVVGFIRPEIVVPRWLLVRDADEQRLVVTHEAEHVRARDPLLLGFGWCVAIAMPWSPAVWYMLSRLRLAVELDCDARVLDHGAAARSYGALLIDVAQHASSLRLSALSLADDSSHLHQRILAMKHRVPRFARLRGGLAAAVALTGVLVACQASLPSDATVRPANVSAAANATPVSTKNAFAGLIFIDGTRASDGQMKALDRTQIESVEVLKGAAAVAAYAEPEAANGVITIKTKRSGTSK